MAIRMAALREEITYTLYEEGESGINDYGDPIMEAQTPVTIPAAVQPLGGGGRLGAVELLIGRDTRIERYVVTVGPDAAIDGRATFTWRGRAMEVIGEPLAFSSNGTGHQYEVGARSEERRGGEGWRRW